MPENKTKAEGDPSAFIASIADDARRADAQALIALMSEISGQPPVLWGPSMIGFGQWRYRYPSGHESDWFWVGFAPRSSALTLYLAASLDDLGDELARLGKHKTGKGCLYIKRLADVNINVLKEIVAKSCEGARNSPFRIDNQTQA